MHAQALRWNCKEIVKFGSGHTLQLNLNTLTKCKPTLFPGNKVGFISPELPVLLGDFKDSRQSVGSVGRQMALNPITLLLTHSFLANAHRLKG